MGRISKFVCILMIATVLSGAVMVFAEPPSIPHNANSMWIEPDSLTFNTTSTSVGYKFNVTVYANVTSCPGPTGAVGAWQFKLKYNNTQLNATKCVYKVGTTHGQSEFFQDIIVKTVSPKFGSDYVLFGEAWAGDPTTGPFAYANATYPRIGGLAIVTFQIMAAPPNGGKLTSSLDIKSNWPGDTYALDYDDASKILDNVYNANFEYSSSQAPPAVSPPYLAVDPASGTYGPFVNVTDLQFSENVSVKSLSSTLNIVNASLKLHYDHTPNILAVSGVTFNTIAWNVASTFDNSTYGVLGIYVETNAVSPPLSGNVSVATVTFTIIHQGVSPESNTVPLTFSDVALSNSTALIPTAAPTTGSISVLGYAAPPSVGATLSVDPPSIIDPTMRPSSTFYINVTIANVTDLEVCQFNLTYDSEVLNAIGFNLLRVQGQYPRIDMILNNDAGFMWTQLNYSTPFSTIDPIPMISIQFHVQALGATFLNLTYTQLLNSTGNPITHQAIGGFFMSLICDVAVTNVVASRSWAYAGWSVDINLTVKNLGNVSETFSVNATYDSSPIGTVPVVNLLPNDETTVTIPWNTSGVPEGNYTITGAASTVPYEFNTTNNVHVDGTVQILTMIHDVAITDVSPAINWVYQGIRLVDINVTAKNLGNFTESFNVTVQCDSILVGTASVVGLAPDAELNLTFVWNTTSVASFHNYTVSGQASVVPFEFNTTNNVYVDGTIEVRIVGDINGDGKVDVTDMLLVAKVFGSYGPNYFYPGSPPEPLDRWDPYADINNDNRVDIVDVFIVAKNFGKTSTP